MTRRLSRKGFGGGIARVLLSVCAAASAAAGAAQWDASAGAFHTHLVSTDAGFQLHLHDKATHQVIDTRKGKVVATMLVGGHLRNTHHVVRVLVAACVVRIEFGLAHRVDASA